MAAQLEIKVICLLDSAGGPDGSSAGVRLRLSWIQVERPVAVALEIEVNFLFDLVGGPYGSSTRGSYCVLESRVS